ncbi:hypothetical protein OHA37_21340 [Streptomyces sp. NBC_00335]|uniref:hypothetical protein n=1 Tax=unclassified Streptomyces TaxID=2593676 RepID=UPI002250176F|nr:MULTISPECIES: hypothetical protein [unclassified Streptomyces]MCX5406407.1 hypothetical protein [Streptomyces sp. NBC_00086]
MTTRGMYFATAALSALALGVAMASGWGQDFPDGEQPTGTSGAAHVEANVQHADAIPLPAGDVIWN